MPARYALLVTLSALLVVACRRDAEPTDTADDDDATEGAELTPITYRGEMVGDDAARPRARPLTARETLCVAGSNELCNALDEDCDGRVDESGCPFETGDVHVAVAWNGGVDLDLYVVEPGADTLSHQRRRSPNGGVFDHDGRGACVSGRPAPQMESVRWRGRDIRAGEYTVFVHRFADCLDPPGDVANPYTQAIVTVTVGEQRLGSYQLELAPRERLEVLRFRVAAE